MNLDGDGISQHGFTDRINITPKSDIDSIRRFDVVYFSGDALTMRDKAYKRFKLLVDSGNMEELPFPLKNVAIYHCGVLQDNRKKIVSAGPTTSYRFEEFILYHAMNTDIKIIIGKGQLGSETLEKLSEIGAIFFMFCGGCGALAAQKILYVKNVFWEDLGPPEAVYHLRFQGFGPLIALNGG